MVSYVGRMLLPNPKPRFVGIDLGTTFSCVGAYHPGTGIVEILADDNGHRVIPSVVFFAGMSIHRA